MDDRSFDVLTEIIIRPSLNEVMKNYRAVLNHSDETLALKAIKVEYDKAVAEFKSVMVKREAAKLDPHKEAAALCSAIVKSRILDFCDWEKRASENAPYYRCFLYPNEMLAFTAAMRIIKIAIFNDSSFATDDEKKRVINNELPYYPAKRFDTFNYLSNTIFYIHRFASQGKARTNEYLFDVGAYATIFYHLDNESRAYLAEQFISHSAKSA